MQGSPALVRRRHKRIGSSTSLDSRSSQPSPLKRGDLTASLPAAASTSLHVKPHEGAPAPTPLVLWVRYTVGNDAVVTGQVIYIACCRIYERNCDQSIAHLSCNSVVEHILLSAVLA